jgi:uncharacterized membrane protein
MRYVFGGASVLCVVFGVFLSALVLQWYSRHGTRSEYTSNTVAYCILNAPPLLCLVYVVASEGCGVYGIRRFRRVWYGVCVNHYIVSSRLV